MITCWIIQVLRPHSSFTCHDFSHAQHPLDLRVQGGAIVGKYYADFKYTKDGKQVYEDSKGVRTAIYRLKKKIVEAVYNIKIVEV